MHRWGSLDGAVAGKLLIVVVGPTAVGKTALAIELCERFQGEIVSADSRQVYCDLDIGTAKATVEERSRVPHHLVDIVGPGAEFTLAEYQELAYGAIATIHSRAGLPFLVGGTGQYVRAVVEGWTIPRVPPRPGFRQRMRQRAKESGHTQLHARLREVDPAAAEQIDPRNVRRVIRALEVYDTTGSPISALQEKSPPPYPVLLLGLTMARQALYEIADQRVESMIAGGLLDEVRQLLSQGYGNWLSRVSAIGYAELVECLEGEISLDEAVRRIKSGTRRFIRQQYNWFRLNDPAIQWFQQGPHALEQTASVTREWLREAGEDSAN